MTRKPHDEAERWLHEARQDLAAGEAMVASRHFNWACFLAQQTAEKAVKAFLYAQGAEDVWGHSVAELLRDAVSHDASLATWQPLGGMLDKFYIPTRYPNGLPGGLPSQAYTADEARKALDWSGELIAAVGERIRP